MSSFEISYKNIPELRISESDLLQLESLNTVNDPISDREVDKIEEIPLIELSQAKSLNSDKELRKPALYRVHSELILVFSELSTLKEDLETLKLKVKDNTRYSVACFVLIYLLLIPTAILSVLALIYYYHYF